MLNIAKHIQELVEFQTSFGATHNTEFTLLPKEIVDLRINMYDEEAEEFLKFFRLNNKVEILDAISDELFLFLGDVVSFGVQSAFEGDSLAEYLEYRNEMIDIVANEYKEVHGKYAPKPLTLKSLEATLGLNDFSTDNKLFADLSEEEKKETIDIIQGYFFERLLLLEIKGRILYGEKSDELISEALTIVWESNMSKLDDNKQPIINGENGVLDNDKPLGKILKSENYWTPTEKLSSLLEKYGY